MQDPQLIWRFGRRIARRVDGVVRLAWAGDELLLRIHQGRAVAAEGPDPGEVARRLDLEPIGHRDLLEEARALAAANELSEAQAVGTAKEIIQAGLLEWLDDPGRRLEYDEGEVEPVEGPGISMTHAVVELVLSSTERDLPAKILPDTSVLLRRVPSFLDLYAPLRLSEEADLVVAKVSGQRTAGEIAGRSPHGSEEVHRLLAALVAAGMLDPVPVATPAAEVTLMPPAVGGVEPEDLEPGRRRLPIGLIAAALVLVAVVLGLLGLRLISGGDAEAPVQGDQRWALVVDMGCEPGELRRILTKARNHGDEVVPVAAEDPANDPCWRLAWGRFGDEAAAMAGVEDIPGSLLREGFEPHAILLPEEAPAVDALEREAE